MPQSKLKAFFYARAAEFAGGALLLWGIFALLALASYNPYDPSYNVISNAVVRNWAGTAGAYIADPILAFAGFGALWLIFLPLIWGYKLLRHQPLAPIALRLLTFIITLPLATMLLAYLGMVIKPPEAWNTESLGGYLGQFLHTQSITFLDAIFGIAGWILYTLTLLLLVPVLTITASGASALGWKTMLLRVAALAPLLWSLLLGFFQRARAVLQRNARSSSPRPKQTRARITPKKQSNKATAEQTSLDVEMRNDYQMPPLDLLDDKISSQDTISESALTQNARLLEKVLEDFGVQGSITAVHPGPVVTLYELEPSPGTKSSRVVGLSDDIARSMSAVSARIAVIPGQNAIGIELPNQKRETVFLRELLESKEFKKSKAKLPLSLGKNIGGESVIIDLAKTPHLLVAGTTGSGKSVGLNAMILSLLYRYGPEECKFIMVDPKMLELSAYQNIPHLLTPVVTEPAKAVVALKWTVKEMENRYRLMSNLRVRNVEGYNQKIVEAKKKGEVLTRSVQTGFDTETGQPVFEDVALDMTPLPFIVVIVDEMADLMLVAGKDIEVSVQRLAQMARAAGIHIILATQRPSVDVITGIIKANFPTRISFQVTSKVDSRTILGEQGAEQLLGMGDMLYMSGGSRIIRVHGPFVSDQEVEDVTRFIKQQGAPSYINAVTTDTNDDMGTGMMMASSSDENKDTLYDQAVALVCREKKTSISFVQRALKIGYNRAANIIEQMEEDGILSAPNHSGKREILTPDDNV